MKVHPHFGASSGLAGEGPVKWLLSGADQNYFGRSLAECSPGGGVIPQDGDQGGDGEQISWGVLWGEQGREELAGRESSRIGRFRDDPCGGFP